MAMYDTLAEKRSKILVMLRQGRTNHDTLSSHFVQSCTSPPPLSAGITAFQKRVNADMFAVAFCIFAVVSV